MQHVRQYHSMKECVTAECETVNLSSESPILSCFTNTDLNCMIDRGDMISYQTSLTDLVFFCNRVVSAIPCCHNLARWQASLLHRASRVHLLQWYLGDTFLQSQPTPCLSRTPKIRTMTTVPNSEISTRDMHPWLTFSIMSAISFAFSSLGRPF